MARLTNKQEAFVQALIGGKSQREAYKSAGYKLGGMSDEAIDVEACKLHKNPKVSLRYGELLAMTREVAANQAVATAVEVLEELTVIGMGRKEFETYDMYGNEHKQKPALPSRLKALELLGKHHTLFSEKVELTQTEGEGWFKDETET